MTRYFVRLIPVLMIASSVAALAQANTAKPATPASPDAPSASATAAPVAAPAASPVPAASATRVGIVNIQAAIINSNEGQRDFQTLQKKFDPKRTELESLNNEVENLKKQLGTTGDKLNEEARNNLLKQIDSKQKSLQRSYEDANNDLQAQQNEIANRIGQKIMEVLDKYAKDNGYSVIFDYSSQASPVLWAANTIDITPAIVAAYNQHSGVPAQQKSTGATGIAPKGSDTKPTAAPKPAAH